MVFRHGAWILTMLASALFAAPAIQQHAIAADTKPTANELTKQLASGDEATKVAACNKLGMLGTDGASAVDELNSALADSSAEVRAHAAWALGQIGEAAKPAAPALAKAVVDPDGKVRRAALKALRAIKPDRNITLPIISHALADADHSVRVHALHSIADMGEAAMPALLKALDHPEGKYWAILVLGEMGPQAKDAVPGLTKLLDDKSPQVRREAVMALGAIGKDAQSAVPAIVKLLNDEAHQVQIGAGFAVGMLGPAAKSAIPTLQRNLKSDDEFTRVLSAWAIAKVNDKDPKAFDQAVDMLAKGIASEDPRVRRASIRGLVDLKPGPAKMLPALKAAADEATDAAIEEALEAVAQTGSPGLPTLIGALKWKEHRGQAAMLLGRMGSDASKAVPALTEGLGDENPDVRREICFALGAIGPDAASATPALAVLLEDENERVSHAAAYALGRIGPDAKAAIPALKQQLDDENMFDRGVSAWALAFIDPDDAALAKTTTPILTKGLENDQAMIRRACANALGNLGPKAASAVDALKAAEKDPDQSVSEAAAAAIKKIKG
jgi:HEAT repeat protein